VKDFRTRGATAPRVLAFALVAGALIAATAGEVPPGWLGVTLGDAHGCARIDRVLPDSPAAHAGLLGGDVVRRAGSRTIRTARDLTETVRRSRPGRGLPLGLERGGTPVEVVATLAARPPDVYNLLEADRDPWQDPARVVALLGIGPGSTIADVGAGGGYFTERLGAAVGPAGHVIAVDIDPDALRQLTGRFKTTPAVAVQRGRAGDPDLAPASVDAILLVDAFHEVEMPDAMLAALRRDLRPGGRLVVVDRPAKEWAPGSHTIPEERVVSQAEAAGFRLRERTDLPRQFAVVLE